MIKVKFSDYQIEMTGHAGYAERGNDIVCAGASMLIYAIANQMLMIDDKVNFIEDDSGYIKLSFNKSNKDLDLLFQTLLNGLRMLKEEYPENINIMEAR